MAGLIIRTPDGKLRSTRLVKPLTSIGRSEDNDIRLEHPSVAESAVHIHYDGTAYRVGSHGGTFQVNGKRRADITIARDADAAAIEAAVLALEPVQRAMEGRPLRKFILVPGRIVNVVV